MDSPAAPPAPRQAAPARPDLPPPATAPVKREP
ncbi:hypothetical protein CLM83_30560, partial [Streptomyces albidoflavus]